MSFKLEGNHQGANPSLYKKYGQELIIVLSELFGKGKLSLENFAARRRQKTTTLSISYLANVLKTRFRL